MQIDGSTKIAGVFGAPVTHTASPAMHNAAFEALRLNWIYLAFHVEPAKLQSALHGACDMEIAGINLTVPHKIMALDIVDDVEPEARKLGAVNTIAFTAGKMRGYNTDGYGIAQAIREEFNLSLKGARILVLGAGGAGRAIAVQCALDGAAKVYVANRTAAKLDPIAREIATTETAFEGLALKPQTIRQATNDVTLVINATSVELREGKSLGLTADVFTPEHYVYDTIYRPPETGLLRAAAQAGAKLANGLSMLLHQGARAFEIWTGQKAPLTVMRRALRASVYGEKP